jgi:hypothetical protein
MRASAGDAERGSDVCVGKAVPEREAEHLTIAIGQPA